MTSRQCIADVLARRRPPRIVFGPNYWQWFTHHQNHGLLPDEIAHCRTQLDMIRHLGLDVFSRNVYCDAKRYWFGGLAEETWHDVAYEEGARCDGNDSITEKTYRTASGDLRETLRYVHAESTLVQAQFVLGDYTTQAESFSRWVAGRRWRFNVAAFRAICAEVGDGMVVAGELTSPLKMLHLAMGAVNTVYLLCDRPELAAEWCRQHEEAQLDLLGQMLAGGVEVVMAMDNLDAMFHTPAYVEQYSASFYSRAAEMCHQAGAALFIHACGRQKRLLPLIASLGVDGLEGVAYPPLGDVELDEAMQLSGDRFLITGGISAIETEQMTSYGQVLDYVGRLFERLRPYAHRFILAPSCNTSIRTTWPVIKHFAQAWRELAAL